MCRSRKQDRKRMGNGYSHSTAPLPPQFLHTGLSFPSKAIAFGTESNVPEFLIRARVEHIHVRHNRRDIDTWDSCNERLLHLCDDVSLRTLNLWHNLDINVIN